MDNLWQDLRYGARMLLQKPGFTLIAVLTLGLGIGANAAIFSVVDGALLRPLPYPEPERLVSIGQLYGAELADAGEPKFLFWREHSRSFEAMAAYSSYAGASGNLAGGNEAEYVRGLRVSVDFFRVLGFAPTLGRAFTAEEDAPEGPRVGILSDRLWGRQFGARESLVGEAVSLNDETITIVGIMPAEFRLGVDADLFVPMRARPTANYDPNAPVVGRLKQGVTLEAAQAELRVIADQFRAAFPHHMQDNESVGAVPYEEIQKKGLAQLLWLMLGAVGFLLLIACANVANLQLTRAAARQREIAVRMAVGARRWRIVRQLLTEGLLLAIAGGTAGLLLSAWGTELLLTLMPRGFLPNIAVVGVDWRVVAFGLAASVFTGLLFGLAPALQARKVDINSALKESAGKGGTGRARLREALVIAEVALSLVLLVGAGLLIRTFVNLLEVKPGFDPHNVLTCQIALSGKRYDTTNEASAFYRDALERIRSLPGVEAAAVTNKLPLDWQFNMPVVFPGAPDRIRSVQFRMISPDYFQVMKIGVQQGRAFTDADNAAGAPVAIVNEAFVNRFFAAEDPLSQQLSMGRGGNDPMRQIIGVVSDAKQQGLDQPAPPMVFEPIPQLPDKLMSIVRAFTAANFVVKTNVPPLSLTADIKREIAAIDPTIAVSEVYSMEQITARSIGTQRFNLTLLGLFAGLGLVLAAVGIYGVTSYSVAQRTREIGLRIALGAQARDVVFLVVKQGLIVALFGAMFGAAGAYALTRLMTSLLYGVTATDPVSFVCVAVVVIGIALLASYLPARRAARVDPMTALRYE